MSVAPSNREDLLRPVSRRELLSKSPEELEAELVELRRMWGEVIEDLTGSVTAKLTAEACPVCGRRIEDHEVCLVSVVDVKWWLPWRMWRLVLAMEGERWERCVALGQGRLRLRREQVWIWAVECGKEAAVVAVWSPSRPGPAVEVVSSGVVASRSSLDESLARLGLAWGPLAGDWSRQLCARR